MAIAFGVSLLTLVTFGFVMLASTSSAMLSHGDAFYFVKRQGLWMGIGLLACAVTASMDYHHHRKYAWPLFVTAAILLVSVLFFGRRINGAVRWFVFGPIRFQPSEFAKFVSVIFLAFWLENMQRPAKGQLRPRIRHWWWGVFAPLILIGLLAAPIFKEPDLGTTVLIMSVTLILLWLGGASAGCLAAVVGTGGTAISGFLIAIFKYGLFQKSYQVQRIIHWWRGDDLSGSNYQQYMAELALGSGGPDGLGLGNSRFKMGYLPEAHTDFIFPIIGEELGLRGTLIILAALFVVVICGIILASRARDQFGFLLASGIVSNIGLQAIINIAVVTNIIPNKGMPLPFVSYGGSSLVMTLAALGIFWNVYHQSRAEHSRNAS